jgi:amino acid transporter
VVIIGGLCGIVTSWNSFLIGGSRAIFSMAESGMLPKCFYKLHPKYKTPVNALIVIGFLSFISPFFGRTMLVWISDAASFACCLAYCIVAMSFLVLRKKEPEMERPYKIKNYRFVGVTAVILSGFMVIMYMLPGSGCTLTVEEWIITGGWAILGIIFFFTCRERK